MLEYFLVLVAVSRVLAKPFEWTALGDSYASGVGSLTYVDGKRCLRYDLAYPVQMNADPTLSPPESIFNNVVCSGSSTADVTAYQFYYEDTPGESWQYGRGIFLA